MEVETAMNEIRDFLAVEAKRISAPPGAFSDMLTRGHKRRKRDRVMTAFIALLVAGGGATVAFIATEHWGAHAKRGVVGPPATLATTGAPDVRTMTVEVGGSTFTVSGSPSPDGYCLSVSGDGGSLGGCGTSEGPFRHGEGGLEANGSLYNVAYGRVPAGASAMVLVLQDGSTQMEEGSHGVWIFALPANLGGSGNDFAAVQAIDSTGTVMAQVALPSLNDVRGGAQHPHVTPS